MGCRLRNCRDSNRHNRCNSEPVRCRKREMRSCNYIGCACPDSREINKPKRNSDYISQQNPEQNRKLSPYAFKIYGENDSRKKGDKSCNPGIVVGKACRSIKSCGLTDSCACKGDTDNHSNGSGYGCRKDLFNYVHAESSDNKSDNDRYKTRHNYAELCL